MKKHMITMISFIWLLLLISGCAVDPLDDQETTVVSSTDSTEETEDLIKAWLWAFNTNSDSVCVYHTIDHECWESFSVNFNQPWIHGALIGGGIYPTLWTWNSSSIFSFTSGILDHSDHGHIVHPEKHIQFSFSDLEIVDMTKSPDGKTISVLTNFEESNKIISFNYLSGDSTTVVEFSDFAANRLTEGNDSYLVTGDSVVLIFDLEGSIVNQFETKSRIRELYYNSSNDAVFIVTDNEILIVDLSKDTVTESLDYPQSYSGEIKEMNFLVSEYSKRVVGLLKNSIDKSVTIFLLDAEQMDVVDITPSIKMAELNTSLSSMDSIKKYCLSEDGTVLYALDSSNMILFKTDLTVNLNTIEWEILELNFKTEALATSYSGEVVWLLDNQNGEAIQYRWEDSVYTDTLSVGVNINSLYLSSFKDNNALFDSEDHTF